MKLISLGAIAVMIQPIVTFCIYNTMDDNTYFQIKQTIKLDNPSVTFQATLGQGGKQCCHYSNKDCSPTGKDNGPASFMVEFKTGKKISVGCLTGGAVSVHGTYDNPSATCTRMDGTTLEYNVLK